MNLFGYEYGGFGKLYPNVWGVGIYFSHLKSVTGYRGNKSVTFRLGNKGFTFFKMMKEVTL